MLNEAIIFILMVAAFITFATTARWPVGLGLLAASVIGAVLGGQGFALRHLVEGAFTYLDAILIIVTAMAFMAALRSSGALTEIARQLVRAFGRYPAVLLPALMVLAMLPGMLSGSSTAAVLTTGGLVAPVLMALGLSKQRAGAFIAMGGIYGMIAPPVNLPVMLIGAGIDIPYVGFEVPLLLASFPLAILTAYWTGWPLLRRGGAHVEDALAAMEEASPTMEDADPTREGAREKNGAHVNSDGVRPENAKDGQARDGRARDRDSRDGHAGERQAPDRRLTGVWAWLPLVWVVVSMVSSRMAVTWLPDLGLALTFALGAAVILLACRIPNSVGTLQQAVREALPVLGILVGVGAFIQVMTLIGGRGWMVVSLLSLPAAWLYLAAVVGVPLFGAVSAYGAASVLGVPLVLAFLEAGDVIVITSALSLLAGLGDLMPPTALAGIFAAQVVSEKKYTRVLVMCLVPVLLTMAFALFMIVTA